MRWQYGNIMHWPNYRESMKKWARDTFLAELQGKYTPLQGGWS